MSKSQRGPKHPLWKGGVMYSNGYRYLWMPNHHRASSRGYVAEHIVVAEKAIGRPLPQPHLVHHVNESKSDNRPGNFVVCEDRGYHNLLHQRATALRECGHANWLKCAFCKQWDSPSRLYVFPGSLKGRHRQCGARYRRERKQALRGGGVS